VHGDDEEQVLEVGMLHKGIAVGYVLPQEEGKGMQDKGSQYRGHEVHHADMDSNYSTSVYYLNNDSHFIQDSHT